MCPISLGKNPELIKLKGKIDITALDIGARGGFDKSLSPIKEFVNFIGFDPDEKEVNKLNNQNDNKWKSSRYIPVALGNKCVNRTLYVTNNPQCTSLIPPNEHVYHAFGKKHLFGIKYQETISTMTLNDASKQYGFTDADFLKIDVQGAELEVLKSGQNLLQDSLSVIRAEVEFIDIYKNQPLFREIDGYLDENDFQLSAFIKPIYWSRNTGTSNIHKIKRGVNCLGEIAHADALYFKKLHDIKAESEKEIIKWIKAALIALAFGRTSYSSEILNNEKVKIYMSDVFGFSSPVFLTMLTKEMKKHISAQNILKAIL